MTTLTTRTNAAPLKVVCLGLSRTGTMSLRDALKQLGFGPCYHGTTVASKADTDLKAWSKIGDGQGTPEQLDNILRGYGSALDVPVAIYPAEMYAAYPDAKFILTVRDPAKWEKSMAATVFQTYQRIKDNRDTSEVGKLWSEWAEEYQLKRYHQGRLRTHTQQEFLKHIDHVKRIIPPEKLLVYQVGEGWDRLVEFLNVPKPETPFPNVNSTEDFQENFLKNL